MNNQNVKNKQDKQASLKLGKKGERAAWTYLKKKGYQIITRNYRAGRYEIDLIVKDGKQTVFVEVKTRTYNEENYKRYGSAADAVNREKRAHILDAMGWYLHDHREAMNCRVDIIEVYYPEKQGLFTKPIEIRHIKSAFGEERPQWG